MISKLFDLSGRTALVTGGGRGLGRSMATTLASAGADLVVAGRKLAPLEEVADQIEKMGRRALPISTDVTKAGEVQAMVSRAKEVMGCVDILVNNSGIAVESPTVELRESDWDRVLDTNLKGAFLCSREVGRLMIAQGWGRVINISSVNGITGVSNLASYNASKAGLLLLTRTLALEWVRYGVTVNALCPGWFVTDMNREFFETEKGQEVLKRMVPMRRCGNPEELAGAILFLASDASSYMTGSYLVIDGGQTAR